MTGSIALDVVIGIVFIYLLYSLYATVIMEIISSYLGLRAKNLKFALKRMLKDERKNSDGWDVKFKNSLYSTFGNAYNLENDAIFERFYNQPAIKYLGNGGLNSKPSYISSETFSKALVDAITISKDPDISLLARIEDGLMNLPANAKDINKEEITTSPLAIIDSATKKHIQSLLDDSNNDLAKFKLLLEDWFNQTMERASGWFRRTTQFILGILGLTIALIFNVDTIEIIKKLSQDSYVRDQTVSMAIGLADNKELMETLKTNPQQGDVQERINSLLKTEKELKDQIEKSRDVLSANAKREWGFYNILGYILTAFAISLGAPFWFDLLNKLVKLRSSKPVETTTGSSGNSSPESKRSILNRAG